jgi:predicted short-subunit dehydrogenase-like oxidoreductase (DUF2520 family)
MSAAPQDLDPAQPTTEPPLCVLGLGAVGTALAIGLARSGLRVRAWSRKLGPLPPELDPVVFESDFTRAVAETGVVLVCVSEGAIAEVAERLGQELEPSARPVVLHTSGFHGVGALATLAQRGIATGVLHPLTALPRTAAGAQVEEWPAGVWFATAGSEVARAKARELVARLKGRELALHADSQPLYHAAATLLSNGAVALFDVALALASQAAQDPEAAREAFAALLASTSANLARVEPRQALTGPAARGEVDVVRGHLENLRELGPAGQQAVELYRALGRRLLELAAEDGRLGDEQRQELARLLR